MGLETTYSVFLVSPDQSTTERLGNPAKRGDDHPRIECSGLTDVGNEETDDSFKQGISSSVGNLSSRAWEG